MSSSDKSQSNGSDDEKRVARSEDPGWLHGHVVNNDKQKTECKYCGKRMMSGGITRLKQHLVGGYSNVSRCKSCPTVVRDQMRELLKGTKSKKSDRTKRDERFKKILFNEGERESIIVPDSDDDTVYPLDCQTQDERDMYRRTIMESRNEEWHREQIQRFHGSEIVRGSGSGSGSGSVQKDKGKGITGMFRTYSQRYDSPDSATCRTEKSKQKTIKGMFGNAREKVGQAVAKYMFFNAIPANTTKGPYLQHMLDVAAKEGTGVKALTDYDIMNKYLKSEKEELESYIDSLKRQWPTYGITIMCDGWTSTTRKQIINFMVYCDGRTIFLKSIDASNVIRDHRYLYKQIMEVIKQVGLSNVVQIVTDNGSNFKKAGEKIMSKYPIYWTPCAAHCIDLILKDFGRTKLVEKTVREAKVVTNFIYNHSYLLAFMRSPECCGGDLIRPGVTRFATNYIALQSIIDKRSGLKYMFNSQVWYKYHESDTPIGRKINSIINSQTFWEDAQKIVSIMKPFQKFFA